MHHIVLFGEVLADIFPGQAILGGAPYNVTRHLHAFHQLPLLISRTGNDPLNERLFSEFSRLGINQVGIQIDTEYPTGQVTVNIKDETHYFNIRPNQAYDYINAQEAAVIATSTSPSIIYFGTLAQRTDVSSAALNSILNNTSAPRFLDINLRTPWYNKAIIEYSLCNADFVKASEEELRVIAALFTPKSKHLKDVALCLIQKFNLTTLFVTCGENGAWALSRTGEYYQVPGRRLNAALIDTVGAGDAFSAVCILGFLYQWPVEETISKANNFAADICKVRGAAPETTEVYLPFLLD